MRSIGKVKIKKINAMVEKALDQYQGGYNIRSYVAEEVQDQIPAAWFDIWESAWSEIDRVIGDAISKAQRGI